jgi:hypothetical protein
MSKAFMLEIPGERPFQLYDNRFFLSTSGDGWGDLIIRGDMADLATQLVLIMLDHQVIARMFLAVAEKYQEKKFNQSEEGIDPATTPVATFVKLVQTVDIDGREYDLTVENRVAKITETFSGRLLWEGEAPGYPFGVEGV